MAYLSLNFVDVKAQSKGVMNDYIAKKHSESLVIPTGKTTYHMALKFFSRDYTFIKHLPF